MARQLRGEPLPEGLYFATWAPGDGQTRYRFFEKESDYHEGGDIYTALGAKEAHVFMSGYRRGRESKHTKPRGSR